MVVGGAGSLFLDESHTKALVDTEEFPEDFKGLANAMRESLEVLKSRAQAPAPASASGPRPAPLPGLTSHGPGSEPGGRAAPAAAAELS